MTMDSTKPATGSAHDEHFLCGDWFDPVETGVRKRIRGFIEELLEAELDAALGRNRYERPGLTGKCASEGPASAAGNRHGHRERRCWERLGLCGFAFPAPGLVAGTARRANGRTRRSPPAGGAPGKPTP